MALQPLLMWLNQTDPRLCPVAEQAERVEAALAAPSPAWEALQEARAILARGESAGETLRQIYLQFGDALVLQGGETEQLEQCVCDEARRLPRMWWRTRWYRRLSTAVEAQALGIAGEPDRLLAELEAELRTTWGDYCSRSVEEPEVTAESLAGHLILNRGLRSGREAVARARSGDGQAAVWLAEQASRLLGALKRTDAFAQPPRARNS